MVNSIQIRLDTQRIQYHNLTKKQAQYLILKIKNKGFKILKVNKSVLAGDRGGIK